VQFAVNFTLSMPGDTPLDLVVSTVFRARKAAAALTFSKVSGSLVLGGNEFEGKSRLTNRVMVQLQQIKRRRTVPGTSVGFLIDHDHHPKMAIFLSRQPMPSTLPLDDASCDQWFGVGSYTIDKGTDQRGVLFHLSMTVLLDFIQELQVGILVKMKDDTCFWDTRSYRTLADHVQPQAPLLLRYADELELISLDRLEPDELADAVSPKDRDDIEIVGHLLAATRKMKCDS
jgi:hypothetical protein